MSDTINIDVPRDLTARLEAQKAKILRDDPDFAVYCRGKPSRTQLMTWAALQVVKRYEVSYYAVDVLGDAKAAQP